jgi:hypothetical protein
MDVPAQDAELRSPGVYIPGDSRLQLPNIQNFSPKYT